MWSETGVKPLTPTSYVAESGFAHASSDTFFNSTAFHEQSMDSLSVLLYDCHDVFMYPLAGYVECCLALIVPNAGVSSAFQQQPNDAGVVRFTFFEDQRE
jgi:hypothetical protein